MALEAAERPARLSQRTLYSTVDAHVRHRTHTGPGVRPARGSSSRLLSVVRREHSRPPPSALPAQRHLLRRPRWSHMFMVVI